MWYPFLIEALIPKENFLPPKWSLQATASLIYSASSYQAKQNRNDSKYQQNMYELARRPEKYA